MEIKFYDSNKNEISLGDIVRIYFPSDKVITLGVLAYNENSYRPYLRDRLEWISEFPHAGGIKTERIGSQEERPDLEKHLGVWFLKNKKEIAQWHAIIYPQNKII